MFGQCWCAVHCCLLGCSVDVRSNVVHLLLFRSGRRRRFRHYNSWAELSIGVQSKQDTDLIVAMNIVERYMERVPQLVADIERHLVSRTRLYIVIIL